ncbi:MAG TPA: hypothetical protein VFV50_09650 [Bdellovibrionales bacterium]|nr:hypothetical protein [Bdellovibrionales bacterium]
MKIKYWVFSVAALAVAAGASLAFGTGPVYSEKAVGRYLGQISSMIAGRPLTKDELDRIKRERGAAIQPILENWLYDKFFADSAQVMIQTQLGTSGTNNGINYNLPGNLAKYLARNALPYSEILRAGYCVDDQQRKIACDTGAPFTAGILTTRAYMLTNFGRYNLGRAGKMMRYFACLDYPMDKALQPPLPREKLIPLFQTLEAKPGSDFGNGLACYTCHSQFGAHAQPYVKFDSQGLYRPEATGLQDPALEAGKSFNGLNASHMIEPSDSASERSQMFGEPVNNLRGAALVLAKSDKFLECATQNALHFYLRMTDSEASGIDPRVIREIVTAVKKNDSDPSLNELLLKALTHQSVIESVLASGEER